MPQYRPVKRSRALEIKPKRRVRTIALTDPRLISRVQTEAEILGRKTVTGLSADLILLGIRLIDLQRTFGGGQLTQKEIYQHTRLLIESTIGYGIGTPEEAARIAELLQNEEEEKETKEETETA